MTDPRPSTAMSAEQMADGIREQASKLAVVARHLDITDRATVYNTRAITKLQTDVTELEKQVKFDPDVITVLKRMAGDNKFWKRVRGTSSKYILGLLAFITTVWVAREPLKLVYESLKAVLP